MATRAWIASASPKYARFRLAGRGPAGILAAYGVLLGEAADEVIVAEPPVSHREGPIFLDVLRVVDVPEALGLLAPVRLRLLTPRGEAFGATREIYRRAGTRRRCNGNERLMRDSRPEMHSLKLRVDRAVQSRET